MFGQEVTVEQARERKKRREPELKGYAALPGTGPEGETCKSCKHYTVRQFAKRYLKCGLMKAHWTSGRGSDIKASAPACRRWEKP